MMMTMTMYYYCRMTAATTLMLPISLIEMVVPNSMIGIPHPLPQHHHHHHHRTRHQTRNCRPPIQVRVPSLTLIAVHHRQQQLCQAAPQGHRRWVQYTHTRERRDGNWKMGPMLHFCIVSVMMKIRHTRPGSGVVNGGANGDGLLVLLMRMVSRLINQLTMTTMTMMIAVLAGIIMIRRMNSNNNRYLDHHRYSECSIIHTVLVSNTSDG